jgi:regulator of protease activity HflC (stomatin/prohibitin superfamily)
MGDELTVDTLRTTGQMRTYRMGLTENLTEVMDMPENMVIVPFWANSGAYMRIPEGCYAGITTAGRYRGVWAPGFSWCWPWTKIEWLITKRGCVYEAPVRNCPTRDNIFISLHVVVTFHFDGGFDNSKDFEPEQGKQDKLFKFAYQLGAESLEDRLQNSLDEHIRALALSVNCRDAYDLRNLSSGPIEALTNGLNHHLGDFGVVVDSVIITSIILPQETVADMQTMTLYSAENAYLERKHTFELREQNNEDEQQRLKAEKKQMRLAKTEDFANMKSKVDKDIQILQADTQKIVAEIVENERGDVLVLKAEGELEAAKIRLERSKILMELDASAKAESRSIKANQDAHQQIEIAKAEFKVTELRAKALQAQAAAEGAAKAALVQKRAFEIGMDRTKILRNMAQNPKAIVSNNHNTNYVASMAAVAGGNTSLILDVSKMQAA